MKRQITYLTCVLGVFGLVLAIPAARADDADAIGDLSKGITEWDLMNQDKTEAPPERQVYVSSSLGETTRKGPSRISIVHGLAAFNDTRSYESEIRDWELQTTVRSSERYADRMYDPYANLRTIRNTAMKTELGMGVKMTSLGPLWTPASTIHTGVDTFFKTTDRVGKSMQVMNPPIYLHEKTSYGWRGEGSYAIPGGQVHYRETLVTAGPGPITRTHTDWVTTNTGSYMRRVETVTPASSNFERFMVNRYPVGNYWDPQSTVTYTTTSTQHSYRVENLGGVERITPLPSTGLPTASYSSPPPTFNATWKSARIGESTYTYPSVDWNSGMRNSSVDWSRVNVGTGATRWNSGTGVNPAGIGSTRISPPISGPANYPPPKILFNTKDPLTTYTSPMPRPTLPSYSPYSTYRIQPYTYRPTVPSSSLGRQR